MQTPIAETETDFWNSVADGQLSVQHCDDCATWSFPPMAFCPECGGANVTLKQTGNHGHIYSWVVAHMAFDPAFAAEVPYTIVAVDLGEGARVLGRLLPDSGDSKDLAGARVEFVPFLRDGKALIGFRGC